jgi:hypothetical protein
MKSSVGAPSPDALECVAGEYVLFKELNKKLNTLVRAGRHFFITPLFLIFVVSI